jgi:hypothetical protein
MINTGAFMAAEKLREYQGKELKELKKFDIDFDFGTKYEQSLANILKLGKVEVKTERDKWNETRNIAIELSCNEDLSGLKLSVYDGNGRVVMGGDNNASEIALIPLKDLAVAI